MRAFLAALAITFFFVAPHAIAEDVMLSCLVTETAVSHTQRTFELTIDQTNQLVYIGKAVATAAITAGSITFRVDLGTGLPFSFAIDRTTGLIRVTGNAGPLYSGQCKVIRA